MKISEFQILNIKSKNNHMKQMFSKEILIKEDIEHMTK